MFHTRLTSKGQVTVPQRFRRRMRLTARRSVTVEQLADGSVVIRPAKSILALAGIIEPSRTLLSPVEEKRQSHQARAARLNGKLKRQ